MTTRFRPNRLGYVLIGLSTLSLAIYTFSFHSSSFPRSPANVNGNSRNFSPLSHLPHRPNPHANPGPKPKPRPFDRESYEPEHDIPLIIEESTDVAEYQQQGLRITLAQLYENARLDILGLDEELGEYEEEGHEGYIYRLSMFAKEYFEGSASQAYLRMMLSNLNLHISPPLLKTGLRKGIIQINKNENKVGDGKEEVEGRWTKGRGGVLKRATAPRVPVVMGGWEDNIWNSDELERAQERLGRGSKRLQAFWGNFTRVEEQTVYIKHMALLLWGGAYTEDKRSVTEMTPISEISSSATQILHPGLLGARGSLQPLAPPPPIPPKFIPPSLDPNWTKLAQTSSEKAISLVLSRHQDGYGILTSDIILAKAFHPVFMDLLDVIARRVDGEFTRLKGDGKEFDSSVLNLNQDLLLEEAVDRYLRVQYATTLEEVYRMAGDEAVVIGDVLLLAPT